MVKKSSLRCAIEEAARNSGMSYAEVASGCGLTLKRMTNMLNGNASMTLTESDTICYTAGLERGVGRYLFERLIRDTGHFSMDLSKVSAALRSELVSSIMAPYHTQGVAISGEALSTGKRRGAPCPAQPSLF